MQSTKPVPHEQALPEAQRTAASDLTLASPPGFDYFTYNTVRHDLLGHERTPGMDAKLAPHEQILSIVQGFWQARAYKWSQFPVIADIGGIGTQLVSILDASPSSKGILLAGAGFALEEVVGTDSPLSLLVARPR